jgi:hypothetical protein
MQHIAIYYFTGNEKITRSVAIVWIVFVGLLIWVNALPLHVT